LKTATAKEFFLYKSEFQKMGRKLFRKKLAGQKAVE
jgi:hypothetical protein